MKILLVISAVCIASTMGNLNSAQTAKLWDDAAFDTCRIAWPVLDVDFGYLIFWAFISPGPSTNFHCFLKCFFEQKGVLDTSTGRINDLGPLMRGAGCTDSQVDRVNAACLSLLASTECNHAFKLMVCIRDNA